MRLDEREQALADSFAGRIRAAFPDQVLSVRAFGSRARGDARPSSDFDILVLVRENDWRQRRQIHFLAHDAEMEHDFRLALSPLVMAEAEFQQMVQRERRLALDILRDGIEI